MEKLLSIIVPVYNKEKYLRECLNSLTHIRFKEEELEVILVDDCSTDSSVSVIQEYVDCYPYIRLIQLEENTGSPSEPRNIGMREAKGKYLTLLDADDWLDQEGFVPFVYQVNENDADIGFGRYYRHVDNKISYVARFSSYQDKSNLVPYEIPSIFRGVGPPGKIFKKELVIDNDIKFEHLQYGEDKLFFSELFSKARSATMSTYDTYHINRFGDNASLVKSTSILEKTQINLRVLRKICDLDIPQTALKEIMSRYMEVDFMSRLFYTKAFTNAVDKSPYYDAFVQFIELVQSQGFKPEDLLQKPKFRYTYEMYKRVEQETFEKYVAALYKDEGAQRYEEDGLIYITPSADFAEIEPLAVEIYPVYEGTVKSKDAFYDVVRLHKDETVEVEKILAVQINNAQKACELDCHIERDLVYIPIAQYAQTGMEGFNITVRYNRFEEAKVFASHPSTQLNQAKMKRKRFKVEMVTAKPSKKKPEYLTEAPPKVITLKKCKFYEDANFKSPIYEIEPGSVIDIKQISQSGNGTPRLVTTDGYYLTANLKFVKSFEIPQTTKYITEPPRAVEVLKGCKLYSTRDFNDDFLRLIQVGEKFEIETIIYTEKLTPRLKTTNGFYLTANASYVKPI
ncbi:DUF5776 domain-containing protein [Staphylococcus sp. SQ8-PEA]|uniref:DUF5776 domain-containing protein n=1 Tax=Staphylococcus marylandisciuri TaxID=2981529 RepID=A0ABT2QQQ4_9STAP|nr:DUF5776 domain-containing protein [Staphylococcus marylandisciuri]MCU5746320.1 DUF5776 domain-containing protein [Staphylococcus marylandisciuri]